MTARADIGGVGASAPLYVAGDFLELVVTILDGDGEPVDIAAAEDIRYVITKQGAGGDPAGPVLVGKSLGSGIAITNGAAGQFTVTIANGETGSLVGSHRHECEVTDSEGRISTVFLGSFVVTAQAIIPAA